MRGYQRGQPVAIAPNYGCGVCDSCVAGQGQHCPDLKAIGIHVDGGFAEYVRVPAPAVAQGNVCPIPEGLSFAEAALAEPLSCVYNSFERAHMVPGDSVLIVGAGPIGLLHAKLYRLAGAGQVLIHDLNEQRLADCARHDPGFVTVGADRPKERVLELTRGRGADVIVTAASSAAAQQLAFELAALDGRVIFFGGLPAGKEVVGARHQRHPLQADHGDRHHAPEPGAVPALPGPARQREAGGQGRHHRHLPPRAGVRGLRRRGARRGAQVRVRAGAKR